MKIFKKPIHQPTIGLIFFMLLSQVCVFTSCENFKRANDSPITSSPSLSAARPAVNNTPPPPEDVGKRVLLLNADSKNTTDEMFEGIFEYLKANKTSIGDITLTYSTGSDTEAADYGKVIYIGSAITEQIEQYCSNDAKTNLKNRPDKYGIIFVQRIAPDKNPNPLANPGKWNMVSCLIPGKGYECYGFSKNSKNDEATFDAFIKK